MSQHVTFALITDTHIGPDSKYLVRGYNSWDKAEAAVSEINQMSSPPDFIVHLGDVCGDKALHGGSKAYQNGASLLDKIQQPLLHLPGNHDEADLLSTYMPLPEAAVSQSFWFDYQIASERFIGLDSTCGPVRHGYVEKAVLADLESVFAQTTCPVTLFLHHPLVQTGCEWMDATMLVKNAEVVRKLLSGYHQKIRGVFCGHVHHDFRVEVEGVRYYGVPATVYQFDSSKHAADAAIDHNKDSGFLVGSISPDAALQIEFVKVS